MNLKRLTFTTVLLGLALIAVTPGGSAEAEDAWVFTTFAGVPPGGADGVGSAARFYYPYGLTVDSSGNLLVADHGNHAIRKITATGVVSVYAGVTGDPGTQDGNLASARFDGTNDIAIDKSGNVYIADGHSLTIRRVSPDGTVTTFAGLAGSSGGTNGTGSQARFRDPSALTVDAQGNVFVADAEDHTIRKITPAGVVSTFAGRSGTSGTADGSGSNARFNWPSGIEIDASGNLYVADANNFTIRKVTPDGVVSTFAGLPGTSGTNNGTGVAARFGYPTAVAVDSAGSVYVTDSGNHSIRKITTGGTVTTIAGLSGTFGSSDGTGIAAKFNNPGGIAADSQGNLFVADSYNQTIRKIAAGAVVTTLAGLASSGSEDGGTGVARFNSPSDVKLDAGGDLVVTDYLNHTIRRINPNGDVTTIAGQAGTSGSANGQGTAARFYRPGNLAVAPSGDIFVSDEYNYSVRKIAPNGAVTLFAGSPGNYGDSDGAGSSAKFTYPQGLAVDASGNVIVADYYGHTLRKITPAGSVSTLAGRAGSSGSVDGTGMTARFDVPKGVAIAPDGNIYVTELDGAVVRKVTPGGTVSTIAGTPRDHGTADGTGSAARFDGADGIAVDASGNLLVTDNFANTIRRVTQATAVTTLAGSPYRYGWQSGLGSDARFDEPGGMAIDPNGIVYVADRATNTIRRGVLCTTGALCTLNGRFELTLTAKDPRTGATGAGVPLQQNDLFGFFSIPGLTGNRGNPEVFVKMLDGRGVNGNFWIFYGGLTDFEYTLTVKDKQTGATKNYTKAGGSSAGGFDVGSGVPSESCPGNVVGTVQTPEVPAPCTPGPNALCLSGGRFRIELAARDHRTDNRGPGASIPQSDLFGYFSIPALTGNPSNAEVFVKMLDGRGLNNHFWIFFSGLTDLEYTMTVTDTQTGAKKTYFKAGGSACGAFDTSAF